jgi:hypothetical protein
MGPHPDANGRTDKIYPQDNANRRSRPLLAFEIRRLIGDALSLTLDMCVDPNGRLNHVANRYGPIPWKPIYAFFPGSPGRADVLAGGPCPACNTRKLKYNNLKCEQSRFVGKESKMATFCFRCGAMFFPIISLHWFHIGIFNGFCSFLYTIFFV